MSSKQQSDSVTVAEVRDQILSLVKEQEQAQQELVKVNHQIQQAEDKIRRA